MKRQAFIKHCLVVLVFVMFLSVGTDVQAKDRKGSCGDDASWFFHDDGTLEITGTGLMDAEPAYDYKDRIKNVIIHEGISSLEAGAFCGYGMESIQLPESLKEIGVMAFWGCSELKEIRIPDGVNEILSYTFSFCSSLEKVILPQGLKTIPAYMFEECTNLKEVNIPDSVTAIGAFAFYDCKTLMIQELPDTVASIGALAFGNCKSITSFRISANVSTIKSGIFAGCDSLTRLEVSPDNPAYDSRDNCNAIIKSSTNALVAACSVTHIPESVTSIGSSAFSSFENLYAIELPENIQTIGSSAFAHCINLECIVIPDKVTSLGEYAFSYCANLKSVVLPDGLTQIEEGAFEECTNLESIVIPNSVETLGNAIFQDCTSLTEVKLSDSITQIPEYAFYGCSLLPTVKIPSGVKRIGDCAFYLCTSLESIAIPAAVTNIARSAFRNCGSLGKISVSSKNEYYDSRNKCNAIIRKKDNKLLFGCNNTVIPSGVTSIDDYAFYQMTGLTSVTIPSSVKSIGEYAFYGCSSLGKIKIPASVRKIGCAAFTNSFSSVTVDSANPVFDSRGNCNAIIKTNNKELLFGCNQTVIPAGIRRIGFRAFESCNDLVSLVIPDGVESIGCGAFDKCSNLTEITIPNSVTEIIGDIFTDCDNLSDIYFKGSKEAWNHIDHYGGLLYGNDHVKVHTLLAQKISAGNVSKSYSSSARKIALNASNRAGLPMTYKCSTSKLSVSADGMLTIPGGYSGKAYVTIKTAETDAYESASKKISVTVRPPKTSIKSASNVSGAKISLSWYKKSSVTGYQIEYGTSSSFSGTTHKKTITSNATTGSKISHLTTGKNYYVRIRTYKTVKDSRIYSLWSSALKVKVTK